MGEGQAGGNLQRSFFFPPSKRPGCRVPGLPSKHFFQLSSCLVLLLSGSHTVAQASLRSVAIFRLPCARLVKQTSAARLCSPCSQELPGLCTGLHCQPVPSRMFYEFFCFEGTGLCSVVHWIFFPCQGHCLSFFFMRHFSI